MKYTLLKMVQLILSSMNSDEVNDINDTVESQQIVDIIETTYNDIASTIDFPEHWDLFELDASGDATRPTIMYLPAGVTKLEWIQYDHRLSGDTARNMVTLRPQPKYEFFDRMNTLDTAESNIFQYNYLVGSETFDIRGYNDRFPEFFTSVDDRTLIFDSYNSDEDVTLVKNKTMCYGMKVPTFTRSNTFVPDLDPKNFSYLLNEAKSQAFIELKQTQNPKADQRARRAQIAIQRNKHNFPQQGYKTRPDLPNYGRK